MPIVNNRALQQKEERGDTEGPLTFWKSNILKDFRMGNEFGLMNFLA